MTPFCACSLKGSTTLARPGGRSRLSQSAFIVGESSELVPSSASVMLSCSKLKVSVHRSTDRLGTQFGRPSALRQRSMGLERLGPPRSKCAASPTAMAAATAQEATEQDFTWKGSDDFTHLDDRKDATPLPLPKLTESKRIVLVRHGQSTWNAEGRIQGSTDFAELTDKGRAQAETTRITVSAHCSAVCFCCPPLGIPKFRSDCMAG